MRFCKTPIPIPRRDFYAVYPVSGLLQEGENVIGISLGNGWKALSMSTTGVGVGEHAFTCQLALRYTDGGDEWIYSRSDDWFYTKEGPVSANGIYQGETYDATRERRGWDMPGYDMDAAEESWLQAVEFEPDGGVLRAQALEPIRVVREMKLVEVRAMPDGSYVFDMGQNFAGWTRLKVSGERGRRIKLVHSELIHDDWTLNQITLRDMRATDEYTLRGEGIEVYEPSFTFHGFRYDVQKIMFFGIDGLANGCYEVQKGTFAATVLQNANDEATMAAKVLYEMMSGADTSSRLFALDGTIITLDNVEDVLAMHEANGMLN